MSIDSHVKRPPPPSNVVFRLEFMFANPMLVASLEIIAALVVFHNFVSRPYRYNSNKQNKINRIIFLYFQMDTFSAVYKKLTGKDVNFEFPEYVL